jgi:hypothetical protein
LDRYKFVENLLRKQKFNKERIVFLENHLKRIMPESHEDYIEYRMFAQRYSGGTPKFILNGGEEVAQLNNVEETASEYRENCDNEYSVAIFEIEKELKMLRYYTEVVEEGMDTMKRVYEKHWDVIDHYYINNRRMEEIAERVHVSRSRGYAMCKEGIRWMARLIYGECDAV